MPSSVSLGAVPYLDGPSFDASIFRWGDVAALAYTGGSLGGVYQGPYRMAVSALSGLNITVDKGAAIIPSAAGVTDGAYRAVNNQVRTLTVTTPDAVNPRIDLVVAGVQDNGDSTSFGFVELVAGTPAPAPAPPSAPANSVPLAQVLVGANTAAITSGNITDVRTYQAAPGGILPLASTSVAPVGVNGQYAYDLANDRVFHMATSGPRQARTLPFAPAAAARTAAQNSTGAEVTLCSVNVTTDGSTDIEIICKAFGVHRPDGGGGFYVEWRAYIDTTLVARVSANNPGNALVGAGAGFTHITGSVTGDTPSAGTHTVSFRWVPGNNGGSTITTNVAANAPTTLYVRPAPL